jgi:hypothetical protein
MAADASNTLETTIPGRPAVPDVLREHIEEIAYLSIQWRKLLFSREIPMRRLRNHAARIEAHLDGLRVGIPTSVEIAHSMLDGDDPWFVSVALRIWIELGQPQIAIVQQQLAKMATEHSSSCKEALRKLPSDFIGRIFPDQQQGAIPDSLLELAADALSWHGLLRPEAASRLAASPLAGVRRALARHVLHSALLSQLLADGDQQVRRMALWNLAKQNSRAALDQSRRLSAQPEPDAFALRMIGLLGEYGDSSRLIAFLRHKSLAPPALLALRDLAYPVLAEAVLEIVDATDSGHADLARSVFESLAGRIPKPNPDKPIPQGFTPARFHWLELKKHLDGSKRSLFGQPFPWQGAASDEPMLWVWRRTIADNAVDTSWLRREVPDGFFTGIDADEAIPGE